MRATIVGPAYPLRGGIAHHVYWLHQQLRAREHSVQVISFRKLYPDLLFPGRTEIDTSCLKLDVGAARVLAPLDPRTWSKASRLVAEFFPDVIVFQWWQPFFGPMVGTVARSLASRGFRCVVECHNVLPHERTPIDRLLVKYAFSPVDCFITHSVSDSADLEGLVPGRKVRSSALPSLAEFSKKTARIRDGRTILFFGKVRKYKGLEVLLEAMPRVLTRVRCDLLIVGEFYDPVEKYHRLVERLGVGGQVRIEDRYVPNEEVNSVFDKGDVLVLPYLSATQSAVARVALSNSLPIIASDTGGLSEVVRDRINGLLVPPGDPNALADALVSYFENGLGPAFSENIADETIGDSRCKLIEIIEEVAGFKA